MIKRYFFSIAVAAVLILACQFGLASSASAQVAGATLSGTITDASGSAVAGASISIKNTGTSEVHDINTNEDGFYSVPNLLPGEYEVTVTAPGFTTLVQEHLTLNVGAQQTLNLALKVGQMSQRVEVTDAPPTVQTSSSTISATVDSTTVRELPLNGRDWTTLATLEPGVSRIETQVGTGFSANKGNRGFGTQLSDAGHRANENTYRVNGVVINDYSNGAPGGASGLNLGVDAIQEFSVLTSNYTAEYGRTSGAVINAITKSGENTLHGTGFFFDRDKIFDARNFFDPVGPIPSFRRTQFGGSGGDAIVKDRTFVFASYEGVRQNRPASQLIHVPTDAERALAVPAIIPYLKLWPEAPAGTPIDSNGTTQTFGVSLPSVSNENFFTAKVDQKLSDKDSLAFSYFFDSGPQSQPDPLSNATHAVFSRRQTGTAEDTHIFTPAVVNTVRVGVNRVRGDINDPLSGNAVGTDATLAIAPGAAATPQIAVPGLTTAIGLGGLNRFLHRWTSYQAYDDAFWTRGTHSIKFGFAFERMDYNITEKLTPNGRLNSYPSLDAFLSNAPIRLNALAPGGSNEVAIRESLFAGYVQDDWRWKPNFTVNIGLRYEFTTLPKDANNRIQEITTLTNCATPGVGPLPTSPCGPVHVNSFIANNPTTKNFEPRVGFSWDPFKDGKTAVRGGFGVFDVLPLPYEFGLNTAATAPFQIIGFDKNATLGSGIDNNVSFNPNNIRNRYIDQNPHRADVLNWNLNIQHELLRNWTMLVGYIGSRSVHLSVAADDINLVPPVNTPQGILIPSNTYQIDPNWAGANGGVTPGGPGGAGIRPVIFDGSASYEGMVAQLKKSMQHGIQGQISYTYGKCRDNSSAPVTGDTYSNSVAVPLLLSKAYREGACDFDLRHVIVGNVIWDVPGPKTGIASYIAGGWELGSIITATSGTPFTVTVGTGNDPLNTGFNGDFSMDYASVIPNCGATTGVVKVAGSAPTFLNTNCFYLAPTVANGVLVGNSGRNRFYGPGLTTVDFSIFKNFQITERFKFQFRAEAFNLLNHTNFNAPNFLNDANNSFTYNAAVPATGTTPAIPASITPGNVGQLGSTSTSSRQIQLGLKLVF